MKKLAFLSIFAVMLVTTLNSCGDECKTCTTESVAITADGNGGYDTTITSIPASEVCGAALTAAESDPITATSGSVTTTITYTCD